MIDAPTALALRLLRGASAQARYPATFCIRSCARPGCRRCPC